MECQLKAKKYDVFNNFNIINLKEIFQTSTVIIEKQYSYPLPKKVRFFLLILDGCLATRHKRSILPKQIQLNNYHGNQTFDTYLILCHYFIPTYELMEMSFNTKGIKIIIYKL